MAFSFKFNRVVLQLPLDLNQPKLNALQKALSPRFPTTQIVDGYVTFRNDQGTAIGFAPGHILLELTRETQFSKLRPLVTEVLELLMLEAPAAAIFDTVAIGDFSGIRAGDRLAGFTGKAAHTFADVVPGVFGVGLRYMIHTENGSGDFRVEPIFVDPDKFWVQLNVNNPVTSVSSALEMGDYWVQVMRDQLLPHTEKLITEKES